MRDCEAQRVSGFRASDYSMLPIGMESPGSEALDSALVLAPAQKAEPSLGSETEHSLSVSTTSIASGEVHSPHRHSDGGDWRDEGSADDSSTAQSTPDACQLIASPSQTAVPVGSFATPAVCLRGSPASSDRSALTEGGQQPGAQAAQAAHQIKELQQQLAFARAQLKHEAGELDSCRAVAAARERELSQQVEQLRGERDAAWQRAQEGEGAHSAGLQEAKQQLAESDGLVWQQASVIAQMEQRLLQGSNGAASLDAPAASLQQLEAENASLRQALHVMQSRLAGGGQPVHDDGNRSSSGGDLTMPDLQARLARLQASMQIKEEQHQRQLSSLRQEHERLRVQEGIRAASRGGSARVKQLEAKLEQVQEVAARRLRAMETRLREAGKAQQLPLSAPSNVVARPDVSSSQREGWGRARGAVAAASRDALATATIQLQQKEQRIRRLESEVARKEGEVAALAARVARADAEINAAAQGQLATVSQTAALQQAMEEVLAANEQLQDRVQQIPALQLQVAEEQQAAQHLGQQLERLQGTEERLTSLQQEHAHAIEEAAGREEELAAELRSLQQEQELAREGARLEGLEAAAKQWKPRLEAAEEAAAEWRRHLEAAEVQLRSARAGAPWTPTAAEFVRLEQRMSESEQRASQREAQWLRVAEEKRQAAQRGVTSHGAVIHGMRPQLDGVLAAARLLA
ncbi:hypothetical protein D9Q98_008314 [Chlorella vulgaris]|uniref:Uncharacterized protein n=1 Tax=Chlorella vulgaris TaxID=3077 RepID=A0A9D4YTF7_CHLVU|nr:hypothetical protein D9Q98_008314 [Chlorella vulgaris]